MAVSNDFTSSELDLNGVVSIGSPTALVWGPDGRLYVTQQQGDIQVLTVAFGDKNPGDGNSEVGFYVTAAEPVLDVKSIANHNDDGTVLPVGANNTRQVTGIDVTQQFDSSGQPVLIGGEPAVVMYVTSSDNRIGAGTNKGDIGLDTNSGVITKLTQTSDGWDAVDIVRGLPRSEENHATNGLEVIQELDGSGNLVSERLIVASGGNANTGAPSNNFAGQQETPYSGALLEVDLDEINSLPVLDDNGRAYVYDLPTLNDPTRSGDEDSNDPFGGNDGLNSAKLLADGPVQIYSAGYRNPYDVEVTDDGRVFTYDNGANNGWGGRPAGEDEDGDTDSVEAESGTPVGYIATNLAVEDNDEIFGNFNPQNWDQLHEATRSDDLGTRTLSAGEGGARLYQWDHPDFAEELTLVYGGHPNPTRAEGARAGLLYSPNGNATDSLLMVSNVLRPGATTTDYLEVIDWLSSINYSDEFLNQNVVAVDPGVRYSTTFASGFGGAGANGRPTAPGEFSLEEDVNGPVGIPADIDEIVHTVNKIEGNYFEAGFTDGALDTGKGSINGLAEYTSSIFDDAGQADMQGALIAASLNQLQYYIIGRDMDNEGVVDTTTTGDRTIAAQRDFFGSGGAPLGLASIGDDLEPHNNEGAFRGTVWGAIYKQNGPVIEILQPGNPETNALLNVNDYAGQEPSDPNDNDLDGINNIIDPFEFDADNGLALTAGQEIVLTFSQVDLANNPEFSGTFGDTGLLGAALDGVTPNRDAKTGDGGDGFPVDQQEDGLFDSAGNIIPGGNAPLLNFKNVQDGTAVGAANTLRDGLHTGVKLDDSVQRLVAEVDIVNWYNTQPGGGRITGLSLSDGTQFNFVRLVFGDIGGGVLGLEVGLEIGDSYQVLETITDPAFTSALTTGGSDANTRIVNLQLEVSDIGGDYLIGARYKVDGVTEFVDIDMDGAQIPAGVLRDVIDGNYEITDGATTVTSGLAVGTVVEKDDNVDFVTVDYDVIRVQGIGNEIFADTEGEAEAAGGAGEDTVVYSGPAADIALHPTVENFDGSGSDADWSITGTPQDNVLTAGGGTNTITTGDGEDIVKGTGADLDGDEITDFSEDDKVIITDADISDAGNVTYQAGSAIVNVNGTEITFSSPEFDNFDPSTGPNRFAFEEGTDGLEITLIPDETVLYRLNAGGATVAALDDGPDWTSDAGLFEGTGPVSITGTEGSTFNNALTNAQDEVDYTPATDENIVPWQLFVDERSENTPGGAELTYNFDVETGKTYKITLYYTENWNNIFSAPDRVFDVAVEGAVPAAFDDIHPVVESAQFVENDPSADKPNFADGAQAEKQPYLGVVLQREFTYTAGDDSLSLAFQHTGTLGNVQNPKINAIQISELGTGGAPVDDTTPPVVTDIVVEDSLSDQDSPRQVTVTVTDETALDLADFSGLNGTELQFTGITPAGVSTPQITLNPGNTQATLVYTVEPPLPANAWPTGTFNVAVAAGTFEDAAENEAAAANFDFTFAEPLQPGAVILAVNAGGAAVDGAAYGLPGVTFEADTAGNPHPTVDFSNNTAGNPAAGGNNANNNGSGETFTPPGLPDTLFTSERWGNEFGYNVDLPNGTYLVDLYFAETYQGVAPVAIDAGVGDRIFDASIEGATVLDDYDLFDDGDGVLGNGEGAPLVKIIKTFEAEVTDGTLNILLDAKPGEGDIAVDNAKISAFVVRVPGADGATVSITGDTDVAEDDGTATYTVALSEAVTVTTVVTVTVSAGSADVSGDVSAAGGTTQTTVTFEPDGPLSQDVSVDLFDDTLPELDETYTVSVSGLPVTIGTIGIVTTTIAANDGPVDSVNGTPTADGDFSDDGLAPTDLGTLAQGETTVVASQQGDSAPGGRERDYFTFTVEEGQVLNAIILEDWQTSEGGTPFAFVGLQEGAQVTVNPETFENHGDLLGGHVYSFGDVEAGANSGNLLSRDALGAGSETGPGPDPFVFGDGSGFDGPLGAGTYTLWLNQGGAVSTATLRLVTGEFVEQVTIAVAGSTPVVENGDFGTTDATFDLTASDGFTGDIEVTYDLPDQAGLTQVVSFVSGAGQLTVPITNDDANNGDDTVTLLQLVSGADQTSGATVEIDNSGDNTVATVTEDDGVLIRGDVVAAFNAGGAALTQDGIDFAAATSGTNGTPFAGGDPFTDGGGGNGVQNDFNGTIYKTEINGGGDDGSFTFSHAVDDPTKTYFVDLYFAEIFASVPGSFGPPATGRLFDVSVEGDLVLDNYDILTENGNGDINTPVVVQLQDPVSPGENGAIDLSFIAEVDRAKVSAVVIREVVGAPDITVSVTPSEAEENGGFADIVFTRTGSTDEPLTVTFALENGTAVEGVDFTLPTLNTVTFAAGDAEATAQVPLIDNDVEGDSPDGTTTFDVTITGASIPSGAPIGAGTTTAAVTINDDEWVNPVDIDGDGILNIDDPFAYDGSNGLDRELTAGNSFRQDFNVDTTDPFDADGGFSGILVNPGYGYPENSETDPYGIRTSGAPGVEISGGTLNIVSTETDAFAGGAGANNTLADAYQSAVDVSGLTTFEVVARGSAPLLATTIPDSGGFEQFGISIGAGGVDDFVKVIFGDSSGGARVELAHNNALGGAQSVGAGAVDLSTVGEIEFKLSVDRAAGANGQVTGQVTFFSNVDGSVAATVNTNPQNILAGSKFESALNGTNTLTGGEGGLAYGVFVTDWGAGDNNRLTASYDFLEIRATEELTLSVAGPAVPIPEAGDEGTTDVVFDLSAPGFTGTMDIDFTVNGVPETRSAVEFVDGDGFLPITFTNDDVAVGDQAIEVVLVGTDNAFVTVDPAPANGTLVEDDAAPVATDDAIVTREDTAITFNPAGNDFDADTAPAALTVTAVDTSAGLPEGVEVVINAAGTVTVTPSGGFLGDVTFGYTVTDPGGNTDTGTATVTVREVQSFRIQAEDFDTSNVFATQGQGAADGGAVAFLPDGGASGDATYALDGVVPPGTYNLLVAYFDENDGVSTIGLNVTSDDKAPFSATFEMDEDTPGNAAQAENLRTKVFANVEVGANGQLVLSGTTGTGEYARVDYFEFIQQDDVVDPENFPAYAPNGIEDVVADENAEFSVDIGAQFFDEEEDDLTFTAIGDQVGGSLPQGVTFVDGVLSGTPSQSGAFTIQVTANDGNSDSAPVQFSLTVNDVPDAPIVQSPIADQFVDQNGSVNINFLGTFTDDDGDALTYALEGDLPDGLQFNAEDGTITGTATGTPGSQQVTIRATDPGGLFVTDSFVFNILGNTSQDPIRLEAEDATTLEGFFVGGRGTRIQLFRGDDGTATFDLTTVPPGSYQIRIGHYDENDGESTIGMSLLSGDDIQDLGSFVLDDDATSTANANAVSFRVKTLPTVAEIGVGDQLQLSGAANLEEFVRVDYIELVPVNTTNFAPTVTAEGVADVDIVGEVAISANIADAFSDPEEDDLTFAIVDGPAWLGVDGAGNLTGTPDAPGTYEVTVSAEDAANNAGILATTSFQIIVDFPANQLPTLDFPVDDITVGQGGLVEQAITFSDPEGGAVTYALSAATPDWLSIDEFGSLSGSPDADDVGENIPVTVIATDPELGTSEVQFFVTVLDANDVPELGTPLENQEATVDQPFEYILPVDAFIDDDIQNGDELTYTATLANGDPLPAWMQIDATTGNLSGTPDTANDVQVVITATDLAGESVSAPAFFIDVTAFTVPTDAVKIEVENFSGLGDAVNFRTNNLASASNDQILRMGADETGIVTHDLSPYAGTSVKVAVTYIDENDGVGAGRVFVDGQLLGSWDFDGTAGVQVNPGATVGNLAQPGNYRTVELDTPVGINAGSVLTLEIDSEGGEFGRVDFVELIPAELPEENFAPTDVTVIPVADTLPEDTDTTAPVKVADIVVTDDFLGTNNITLTGADAANFTVVGTELFLNAGVTLDFEAAPTLDLTVQVDDTEVGDGPFDVSTDFTLAIGDVNEAPVLTVTPVLTNLSQDTDTSAGVKVADITVADDALGSFTLDITGADAGLFEIVTDPATQALSLNLIEGAALDALGNPSLDVAVELDDPSLGGDALEGLAPVTVAVTEGPLTDGQALFTANLTSASVINASTFGVNNMQVTNQSSNDVSITRVVIDLADTLIPDIGFDTRTPAEGGPIGDDANKPFSFDGGSSGLSLANLTITMNDEIVDPQTLGEGDNELIIDFAAGTFGAGDVLSFSIDIDPFTAINGPIGGAVAGFEISGGTVTVEFDDGSSATSVITPPDGTIAGRALVTAGQEDLGTPVVTLGDGTTDARVVTDADLPILIDAGAANAGATVRVFILDTAFVSGAGSFSIDPPATAPNGIQGNNAQKEATAVDVVLDSAGQFSGTIPLTRTLTQEANANGNLGFNYFAAGVVDSNGEVTQISDPLVVEFDPNGNGGGTPAGDALLRINAFGEEIIVADGPNWQADTIADTSPFFSGTQNRGDAGTPNAIPNIDGVPNEIFATARSDNGEFSYNIPISELPGIAEGDTVTVNLYFAESPSTTTLTRIFDIEMENALAVDDLDPQVAFGQGNGGVISTVVEVVGDTLNIEFLNNNLQNAIVSGIEIVEGGLNPINGGGVIEPPADPADALEVLGIDDGDFDGFVQGQAVDAVNNGGDNGSVVLTIMDGNNTVDASNFGANSLELTNTGNKEVAAVFIDVRNAVFADQVFDNDGTGGDTASKAFQINTDGGTGAFFLGANGVNGSNDDNLFFEGDTPAADTSGQSANGGNAPISGGYRGLLIRFDGTDGGFDSGETVGFSGDGDSNSLAGFASGLLNPNNVTSTNFDTGGQSGSELVGSSFTVLFADGTTATGYLGSDTTQAGAAGEAVQGRATKEAILTVNTGTGSFDSGQVGTYAAALPTLTVAGTPGDTVRVTLHKGFQPTDDGAGGSPDTVAEVIQGRLDDLVPNFAVNNAFDVQTFDVTIGANGLAVLPDTAFDYNNTISGESFPGDDVQPLAFTAAVVEQVSDTSVISGGGASDLVPVGPVSQPIYLTNPTQVPVNDGGVEPVVDGYFEIVGSGSNQYFKIQIEDGSGGENPGGKWEFLDAPDGAGNQSGFQGDGYYLFGSETSTGIDNQVGGNEVLEYNIFVPEGAEGTYTFSFRVARDGNAAGDQQNDLWLNFKHAEEAGNGEIVEFLTGNGSNVAEPDIGGYIKLFGGPNDGDWGTTSNVDGLPGNFQAAIEITEPGLYTVQVDGRSQGFHVDSFELYKGSNPSTNATGSAFIEGEPGTGGGGGGGGGGTPTGDPIRIQAEDATSLTGNYVVQNIGPADGGQAIGISGGDGDTGGATYNLGTAGVTAGTYNVTVGFFDETDGVSSLEVNVGGTTQTITFDDTSGSDVASPASFREVTLTDILVDGGDVLSISAVRDMGELVRVDYFDFTPTDGGGGTGGGGGGTGGGGGETPDQLVIAVDASADDFEEQGGAGSSDLEFGLNGSSPQAVGIRFDDIDIPAGATIAEAYLRFEAFETSSGAASFTIGIEDSTNPASYSSANGPGDRAYADEFVWNNVEAWVDGQTYETPDISSLINQVVDAGGGSDIALAFQIEGSGSRVAHSFNSTGDNPELVIVFENDTIF